MGVPRAPPRILRGRPPSPRPRPPVPPPPPDSPATSAPVEREPSPVLRAVYLFAPAVVTAALYAFTWVVAPPRVAAELVIAATATVAIGTPVILGAAALGEGTIRYLSTWDLCAVVAYMTVAGAFFWSFNLDLLQHAPWIGPRLARARVAAVRTLAVRPWIRRWATFGVAFFVFLPLPGSGSLGGSIVGRLVGLSRIRCFLAVGIAGALVCLGYAWFGVEIDSWAKAHAVSVPVRIASVVASLVCVWLLLKWAGHLTRRRPTAGGS